MPQKALRITKTLALAKKVITTLKKSRLFITTVESCTGGGLVYYLTNISGASDVLRDSFVTYSNEAKLALGVPKCIINKYSVYSAETAKAMAEAGLRKSTKADVCVAITGSISRL